MRFLAALRVLWKTLAVAGKAKGKVRWTLDLGVWDPNLPNQKQNPMAWRCEIDPDDGGPGGVAFSEDGADALLNALGQLVKARKEHGK